MKNVKLVSQRYPLKVRIAREGVWYIWNAVGDVVSTPDEVADMLTAPGCPYGTFQVMP
jgi:hypothetical protein